MPYAWVNADGRAWIVTPKAEPWPGETYPGCTPVQCPGPIPNGWPKPALLARGEWVDETEAVTFRSAAVALVFMRQFDFIKTSIMDDPNVTAEMRAEIGKLEIEQLGTLNMVVPTKDIRNLLWEQFKTADKEEATKILARLALIESKQ